MKMILIISIMFSLLSFAEMLSQEQVLKAIEETSSGIEAHSELVFSIESLKGLESNRPLEVYFIDDNQVSCKKGANSSSRKIKHNETVRVGPSCEKLAVQINFGGIPSKLSLTGWLSDPTKVLSYPEDGYGVFLPEYKSNQSYVNNTFIKDFVNTNRNQIDQCITNKVSALKSSVQLTQVQIKNMGYEEQCLIERLVSLNIFNQQLNEKYQKLMAPATGEAKWIDIQASLVKDFYNQDVLKNLYSNKYPKINLVFYSEPVTFNLPNRK